MNRIALALIVVLLGATRAGAAVIGFESLANPGPGVYDVGFTYSEAGFTLTEFDPDNVLPFVTFGQGETRYGGSPALYNNNGDGGTRLTRDGGGEFALLSIDLANDKRFGATAITFTGTKSDASTVSQSFTIDTNNVLTMFQFSSDFTDLTKVEWRQLSPFHQFDNITVETPATPVPEPGTMALMAVGFAVLARRQHARKQRTGGPIGG